MQGPECPAILFLTGDKSLPIGDLHRLAGHKKNRKPVTGGLDGMSSLEQPLHLRRVRSLILTEVPFHLLLRGVLK